MDLLPNTVHFHYLQILLFVNLPASKALYVSSKSILTIFSWPFADIHRVAKIFSCLMCMFPAEVKQCDTLSSQDSFQTVNKCSFCGPLSDDFLHFLLFIVHFLFKTPLKSSVEVLSSVPKWILTVFLVIVVNIFQ